jgi:putative ubiquitin-RnfH superfamily antitoxin RatB of RatAB toxin-antitoxin module
MFLEQETTEEQKVSNNGVDEIFGDLEARHNIVGLYDLLYKIDQRINPHLYEPPNKSDHD